MNDLSQLSQSDIDRISQAFQEACQLFIEALTPVLEQFTKAVIEAFAYLQPIIEAIKIRAAQRGMTFDEYLAYISARKKAASQAYDIALRQWETESFRRQINNIPHRDPAPDLADFYRLFSVYE